MKKKPLITKLRKLTTKGFIERSIFVHNYKYDYSKVSYHTSKTKVEIICRQDGHSSFMMRPNNHLNGQGCPKCGLNFMENERFIRKSKELHNDKYLYIDEYLRSNSPIKIFCKKCNKEFTQTPNSHLCGCGCPNCQKTTKEDFIYRSNKIHNGKYIYDLDLVDFKNQKDIINIYCKIHGNFKQNIYNHLNGHGCKKCGYGKLKISIKDFIKRSNNIHGNKYEYVHEYFDYDTFDSSSFIKIKCPHHGIFKQKVSSHLIGNGCRDCYIKSLKSNTKDFVSKAIKIHTDEYDYSSVNYKSNVDQVVIKCNKHGEFNQTPNSHLKGSGCPICKSSKGERRILNFLKNNNISYKTQYVFDDCYHKSKLRYDFYLPENNIVIEYDGRQHFDPIEKWGGYKELENIKFRDEIKNNYCTKNDIFMIRIPYHKYNKIEEILSKKIMNNLCI